MRLILGKLQRKSVNMKTISNTARIKKCDYNSKRRDCAYDSIQERLLHINRESNNLKEKKQSVRISILE